MNNPWGREKQKHFAFSLTGPRGNQSHLRFPCTLPQKSCNIHRKNTLREGETPAFSFFRCMAKKVIFDRFGVILGPSGLSGGAGSHGRHEACFHGNTERLQRGRWRLQWGPAGGRRSPFGDHSGAHGSQQGPKMTPKWMPKVARDKR